MLPLRAPPRPQQPPLRAAGPDFVCTSQPQPPRRCEARGWACSAAVARRHALIKFNLSYRRSRCLRAAGFAQTLLLASVHLPITSPSFVA